MKKVIFIDGIDGSGKSSVIEAVSQMLSKNYRGKCLVYDGNNPVEYKRLYKISEQPRSGPSHISVLSYRLCRINLLLSRAINASDTITIFDRGIFHLIVQCQIDNIESDILNYFLANIYNNLDRIEFGHVLLDPPFEIARARIDQRENADALDLDTAYQENYYQLLKAAFMESENGRKISIDTNANTVTHCGKEILDFIGPLN